MSQNKIPSSELILNEDGSVYHLAVKKEHIADTVLLVGDPERVKIISSYFDKVEFKVQNREFLTHTGYYKNKRITVLSTGIGTDNIDIVLNELDAAVNINLSERTLEEKRQSLNLIRIGTSGSLQEDIDVGSFLISEYALGFDGLLYYYNHDVSPEVLDLNNKINDYLNWSSNLAKPYLINASEKLISLLSEGMIKGITATATGFYAPQGRKLYLKPAFANMNEKLASFKHDNYRITNLEMETSGVYSLGSLLGHNCCTCCAIIANRVKGEFSKDPVAVVKKLILNILDKVVSS